MNTAEERDRYRAALEEIRDIAIQHSDHTHFQFKNDVLLSMETIRRLAMQSLQP